MHYLRIFLLLFIMTSVGLFAGIPSAIEKDSKAQKEMKLSVTHKESQQDTNKVTVTVTFKGDKFTKVTLISGGNNKTLKTELKDDMVTMTFDVDKANLEKSSLNVTSSDPQYAQAMCGPGFLVYLKGYVA